MSSRLERLAEQRRIELVNSQADSVIERLGLAHPIDPLAIVESESPFIRAAGTNLGSRYDGKLEYYHPKNRFLLFFNSKYDEGLGGRRHPRTRFSIAHELGHYFIEEHRAYLMTPGAKPHESRSEFRTAQQIEREADAFASTLLLPTRLIKPLINSQQLSIARLQEISSQFDTSLTSTLFRAVRLSHFPCAVAAIRQDSVAWMFVSDVMIEHGLYPRRGHLPSSAQKPLAEIARGSAEKQVADGRISDWFSTYDDNDADDVYVQEEYVPATYMEAVLVLLTIDESDLSFEEEGEDD
jgi:hypothetical protein